MGRDSALLLMAAALIFSQFTIHQLREIVRLQQQVMSSCGIAAAVEYR